MSDEINGMIQAQAELRERLSLISNIKILEKRVRELQEERDGYKNGQIQLQGMVDDLMDVNAKWVGKVRELESKEIGLKHTIDHELKQAESRIKRLEEAVDRHEIFKRAHERVVALEDEELYQKRKEG
jgi:DNA repair exonuclease SbcCD ATPase subunit